MVVKQVRWHPASPNSCHLAVLTTDDTLRLYSSKSMNLVTVWHPERAFVSSSLTLNSHCRGMQTLASLGETAIDFDFTPPVLKGDVNYEKSVTDWPILILRGNGDIFILSASLTNKKNSYTFEGPLPVYPPADDNYGMEDASSLIVLKTSPPVVVVATGSGNLYHSMLLSFSSNEEKMKNDTNSKLYSSDVGLYVFECIELELGFSLDNNSELYSCPIVLHEDQYVPSRYFCTHEAGLHAVILPIVYEFDKFAKCDEDDADKYLPSFRQTRSSAEYLICTRINSNDTMLQDSSAQVLGLQITEYPCVLIALMANGELTTFPLISTTLIRRNSVSTRPALPMEEEKNLQMDAFHLHVSNILKSPGGTSRPILKLDPSATLSTETYTEILHQEMDGLRDEYFPRYQKAIKEIEKRMKFLSIMKQNQIEEMKETEKKQIELVKKAEQLRNCCKIMSEKQDNFNFKTKELVEKMKKKQPKSSFAQRKVQEKLKEYSLSAEILSQKADELLKKQQFQENKMSEAEAAASTTTKHRRSSSLYLSEEQQKSITENLIQIGREIAELKNGCHHLLNTTVSLMEKNKMT